MRTGVEMTTSVAEGEAVSVVVAEMAALDSVAGALAEADSLAEVAAAEVEAGALVEAALEEEAAVDEAEGTEMLTPYWEHRATTCSATVCWSAAEQAFWTQGVISSVRPGTLQWHSKSVREEQPSLPSVVTKQLSEQLGRSEMSWE